MFPYQGAVGACCIRWPLDWHRSTALPGYADVFDLLDGVIRQLSGDSVRYPTSQPTVVSEIATIRV